MPEKPFTKYLLRLATDPSEVERFRKGGVIARTTMEAAGLDREQIDTLLRGDQERISAIVASEISAERGIGLSGVPVEIVCIVQVELDLEPDE